MRTDSLDASWGGCNPMSTSARLRIVFGAQPVLERFLMFWGIPCVDCVPKETGNYRKGTRDAKTGRPEPPPPEKSQSNCFRRTQVR